MNHGLVLAALLLTSSAAAQGRSASPIPTSPRRTEIPGVRVQVLPLALGYGLISSDGETLALHVSESRQGVDLDGDGYLLDDVVHLHSMVTGVTRNTGFAAISSVPPDVVGGHAFVRVDEDQGGVDLNGDGDIDDTILYAVRTADGVAVSSGLAGTLVAFDGHLAAVTVTEYSQGGIDLNGNGSISDRILHVWNLETNVVTSLDIAVRNFESTWIHAPYVLFSAQEDAEGDLNGDGDVFDRVLYVYDAESSALQNTGKALAQLPVGTGGPIRASGPTSAYLIAEYGQQEDLNGDGDLSDQILHVFDTRTGIVTNLGLDVDSWCRPGTTFDICSIPLWKTERYLAFQVALPTQSRLNLYDYDTGILLDLGVNSFAHQLGDEMLAFTSLEPWAGDLNGDGDTDDQVVQVVELENGILHNTGLAIGDGAASNGEQRIPFFRTEGPLVGVGVSEQAQGGIDLNGDGDAFDWVPAVFDVRSSTVTQLHTSCDPARLMLSRTHLIFVAPEYYEGRDLNGDGDVGVGEGVVFVHSMLTGRTTSTGFTVESSYDSFPPRSGVWWTLRTREASVGSGIDWNGDGDTDDEVPVLLRARR